VIFANILLGISQGLTWSSTVVMKMDLVGEKIADWRWDSTSLQAISPLDLAFLSGYIAEKYGLPLPFLSELEFHNWIFTDFAFVKDTLICTGGGTSNKTEELDNIFIQTSFKNKTLSAITQAGLVNNLNDGMIWGLLPRLAIYELRFSKYWNYSSQSINSLGLRSIIYRKNV
jgi:hypothetical protein